jgi:TRAP-type C4-dicarboxylate transport system permease small subunit
MVRIFDTFEAGLGRLTRFLAVLVAISIGLITVLIPLNLLLVKTQLGGLWWLYEAVEYALYVGVFIGAPWVLQQGAHVRVDVILSALPRLQAVRLERLVDLASALLCLGLCYYGARATLVEFAAGTLPDKDLRIANWTMTAVFAFSFLLLAVEFGFRFRRAGDIVAGEKATRGF